MARLDIPPAPIRKFFDDVRVGNRIRALAVADDLAQKCSASAIAWRHTPAVILLHGELLAADGELGRAADYLTQGLAMLADTGPHAVVGSGDHHRVLLTSTLLPLGRYAEAAAHLDTMEEPQRPIETRFAALRTRAQLATIRGNAEMAHHLLNTAASVAQRIKGSLPTTLIDADRASLLATQGRLFEAVTLADLVLSHTMRPGRGPIGRYAGAVGASVAFTMSRHAADQGRGYDAERYLVAGISSVERSPSTFLVAHMELAMARAWRGRGQLDLAEDALGKAASGFARLGALPSSALVSLEEACLSESRRLGMSTRVLFGRALAEFEALGHAWEVSALRRHLGLVDEHARAVAMTARAASPIDERARRRERLLN